MSFSIIRLDNYLDPYTRKVCAATLGLGARIKGFRVQWLGGFGSSQVWEFQILVFSEFGFRV